MAVPREIKTDHPGHIDSEAACHNTELLTHPYSLLFYLQQAKKWNQPGCPSGDGIESVVCILSCKKMKLQMCKDMNRFGKYYIK